MSYRKAVEMEYLNYIATTLTKRSVVAISETIFEMLIYRDQVLVIFKPKQSSLTKYIEPIYTKIHNIMHFSQDIFWSNFKLQIVH